MNQLATKLTRVLRGVSAALFGVGLIARLAPLMDVGGRVFRQFPTEDGYLMLTIARNLSLGRGMSTAEGELPTNGTQPLFNLVEAGIFWIFRGERFPTVLTTQLVSVAVSACGAWLLYRLARDLFGGFESHRTPAALLASAMWFASPVNLPHTMNCLETGLYQTLGLLSFLLWLGFVKNESDKMRVPRAALVGCVLGITFLARIDAAFLIAALTIWNVIPAWPDAKRIGARLVESAVMGVMSIVVGSPWLIYNYVSFGSLMPISGTAQSYFATFGSNLAVLPAISFEYLSVVLLVPHGIARTAWMMTLCGGSFLVYVALSARLFQQAPRAHKRLFAAAITYGVCLVFYYGLYFGADHFVHRYLSPLTAWFALSTAALLVAFVRHLVHARGMVFLPALGLSCAAVFALGLNLRTYLKGEKHMHFQVVEWVDQNVSHEQWVAAIQTGTLGFFHERTINLDGKVNPEALKAKLAGEIPAYIVHSTFGPDDSKIQYVVEWETVAPWIKLSPLDSHFELIINDPERRLAVLKRLGSAQRDAALSKSH